MKKIFPVILLLLVSSSFRAGENPIIATSKPWTYWWWMGSSVTKNGITYNLTELAKAGFGGVHIIPVYGERGDEDNYISYLSPEWMEMLVYTTDEANRLGLGVDMTCGTGWPFGGPHVDSLNAAKYMGMEKIDIVGDIDVDNLLNKNGIMGYALYDENNSCIFSSGREVRLDEEELKKAKYIILLEEKLTGQKVKRAAPGGEGLVIDYFSKKSVTDYMYYFKEAFQKTVFNKGKVRAFYNDSYEVAGANFTTGFLAQFRVRRGYDLLPYLHVLRDSTDCETRRRLIIDYCETVSDILLEEFTVNWVEESRQLGMVTRSQAHGSPGNLIDLYGTADIPETESFGSSGFPITGLYHDPDYPEIRFGRPNPLTLKFSSSAANMYGRKLVSSETATWLADHFKVTLSQVKPQIDELFVSGINHVFYHGIAYSPPQKEFPGRLFYASTNFGPYSHFWNELPLLNRYVENCQTILQHSTPDNDILLYFAIHDVWNGVKDKKIIPSLDVHKSDIWLKSKATGRLAENLWHKGFSFDYVSDRNIRKMLSSEKDLLSVGNLSYKALLVPAIELMPVETLKQLYSLALDGAPVYFERDIPEDVPGLFDLENRKKEIKKIKSELLKLPNVKIFRDISEIAIPRETLVDKGLHYIRKTQANTTVYFITNLSDKFSEGWVELLKISKSVGIYDPQSGKRGRALVNNGKLFLQLSPGMSCFIICSGSGDTAKTYPYYTQAGEPLDISRNWLLKPEKGFPHIPQSFKVDSLVSWTKISDDLLYYSGTVTYTKEVELPDNCLKSDLFMLEIGQLKETAEVKVNGRQVGTIWSLPNRIYIPSGYFRKHNKLEIKVTNTSFNRVIDMDKQKVKWKNYHEVNFVNIRYELFDASGKEPVASGMMGLVTLTPKSTSSINSRVSFEPLF